MVDLLRRRKRGFVLWRPARTDPPPRLVIGRMQPGNPPTLVGTTTFELGRSPEHDDLWELPADRCGLDDGVVYHYWFEVADTAPWSAGLVRCTDPFVRVVDYRVLSSPGDHPAGVVKLAAGTLVDCDPDGDHGVRATATSIQRLAANHRLVIYELPTSWTRGGDQGGDPFERDVGTFRDVLALLDADAPGANFGDLPEVSLRAHLVELGVNALELLPPADSPIQREWGYATGNYFAADYDLGYPKARLSPSAECDLHKLVARAHACGIRFFLDVVMAFGHDSYRHLNFTDFHLDPQAERDNPDAYQSSRQGELREAYGGSSWRYGRACDCYDPLTGQRGQFVPARRFMLAHIVRWLDELGVDGVRVDSVNNVGSWDFLQELRLEARRRWQARWHGQAGAADRFLVLGEELSVPLDLLHQGRLEALWNEGFRQRVRAAIAGEASGGDDFQDSVAKMIDCRRLAFADGAQAVNYVTSHDVEGYRRERLTAYLSSMGVIEKEPRIKLAFVCLLTAVGIPMILAGEEFADEHDRPTTNPDKQKDPLNFARLRDPWRRRVFDHVARLVRLRTTAPALGVNDTTFIHSDFTDGRRILVWVRGRPGIEDPVVVVANFSEVGTPGPEYRIENWPATPPDRRWREVTQDRDVPREWIGREPHFPWEAKVYTLT